MRASSSSVINSPYFRAFIMAVFLLVVIVVHHFAIVFSDEKKSKQRTESYMDGMMRVNDPKFDDPSLSFPTKCVSCERQFPIGERWAAQPTKCFSCEAQEDANGGAQYTHPNKCHACEQQHNTNVTL